MQNVSRVFFYLLAITVILALGANVGAATGGKININKASVEELTALDGVGSTYAERIVEYREKNGGFDKPEDIMNVKGIGQKTYENNKDRITVD
jgi:competence protein ComEA